MDFSPGQYDALIQKIENGLNTAVSDANAAISRIEGATSWIPGIGSAIKEALDKFVSLMKEFMAKVGEALKWTQIPPTMWQFGQTWLNLATQAGQTAVNVKDLDSYSSQWQGIAGGKYATGVAGQRPAVDTIQARCNQISGACTGTAISGLAFYISVATTIIGLIIAIAGAELVFPLVAGIITAIVGLAGAVASLLIGVEGQARTFQQANEPSDSFPGNAWPQAVAP